MSFGRAFVMGKEGRYTLSIRAEFQNIFNRLFLSMPLTGPNVPYISTPINPATGPSSVGGVLTGGFGTIPTVGGAGDQPRAGQIVGRFTF